MTKSTQFFVSATRLSRWLALLVVCSSIWPAASSAQLTQQDVYEAVYEGVMAGIGDLSAEGGIYTVPMDMALNEDLANLLTGTANYQGVWLRNVDVGYSAALITLYLRWLVDNTRTNGDAVASAILDYLVDNDLGGWLQEIEEHTRYNEEHTADLVDLLSRQHFNGDDLQVYDGRAVAELQGLSAQLSDLATDLDGISSTLPDMDRAGADILHETRGIYATVSNVVGALDNIYTFLDESQLNYSNYWSREPPSSYPDVDADISSEESDAEGYFDTIELPIASGESNPQPSGQLLDEGWLELNHVDVDEDHNALIRLVDAPSRSSTGPIPTIEVDLGRNSALDLGMRNFASWVQWLVGALFGLLLSVKGLGMWRVVRTASVAAQAGTDPFIHLAWHPF